MKKKYLIPKFSLGEARTDTEFVLLFVGILPEWLQHKKNLLSIPVMRIFFLNRV